MTQADHAPPAIEAGAHPAHSFARRETHPLTLKIPRQAEEVRRARHWFRSCLRNWHDDDVAAAESIFAEVAANAFRHSRGQITVTVRLSHCAVRCDVRDSSWCRPCRISPQDPELEEGRGMAIVAALADDWGVRRRPLGKTVWFVVRAPARPEGSVPVQ